MSTSTDKSSPKNEHLDAEKSVKRNPHGDFNKVQASRPDFDTAKQVTFTKTVDPNWKYGQGGNDGGESLKKDHVEINPHEEGRPPVYNYKLLISGIVPRPIGFIGTQSKDGTSDNLAPFSYTQVVNHDPPVFIVGFAGGMDNAKDTLKNLLDTGECVINIVSEHFIEAANACSINSPYGTSEWSLTGLHPAPSTTVKAPRVKEAVFSVEGKLMNTQEFESRATPGKKTGVLAVIEGTNFWVREDAINEDKNLIDPNILRPIGRVGGITYSRNVDTFEIPRPVYNEELEKKGN
ncbi:putative flavoprotein oxygenase [Phaeomoniella chlamydospora]|uniref:Putative flavoprotein oxygenase n=1 Tax=Phaeomoniella chlamydospora TaxID=158046 RepID=A0A0G2EKR5_PHACM|nr:putative flavoprotein oxygenase [Phaeomoniella chlamydospora]